MEIDALYEVYRKFPCVVTDSRKVVEDSIFFALKGDSFNGNKFAEAAIEKGSRFAVIDEIAYRKDERFILVDCVLTALQQLAKFHREQFGCPVIGITGTNGKTTTKELITAVLAGKFKVSATKGNLNNHIGVPLTLLEMNDEVEIGIVEMGANHPGEIADLCSIAQPDHGLITNIGKAHIEGFGSFEGVKRTKNELYKHLIKINAKIFVNSDNEILIELIGDREIIKYGKSDEAFCRGKVIGADPFLKLTWEAGGEGGCIDTNLIGEYNFENVLAAICVGRYFNIEGSVIKKCIESYFPTNNRSQIMKTANNTLLLDAYNANPTSMTAAIENFSAMNSDRKVLILGDMLELGSISHEEHSNIYNLIIQKGFEKVYLVGPEFKRVNSKGLFNSFENVTDLRNQLAESKLKDSFVLMKGSRGIRLEKAIEVL